MASTVFLIICAQILLIKMVFTQTCGYGISNIGLNNFGANLGLNNNLGANLGLNNIGSNYFGSQPVFADASLAGLLSSSSPQLLESLSYGGVLTVSSGSSIAPNGITVLSENLIDGAVAVNGNIPFLGAVTVGGSVPSAGQAAVTYNTRPGVGLSSGGCGAGLAGGNVLGLSGGVGFSGANVGLGLGNGLTCGCGL